MRVGRRSRSVRAIVVGAIGACAMALVAGCASDRSERDPAPYDSGRYRGAPLVTTRPAPATRPATTAASTYRLPTTNLSPAYDYGDPRDPAAYVDIGPYNPGIDYGDDDDYDDEPDYDTANRTLYEHHDGNYAYPYSGGYYGSLGRPPFLGSYSDWYYGPRYRHWSHWHKFDRHRFDRLPFGTRFDARFDRFPYPHRHHVGDPDAHDWRRRWGADTAGRDRGDRYRRDPRRNDEVRINRAPQQRRASPARRGSNDDGDDDGNRVHDGRRISGGGGDGGANRAVQPQRAPRGGGDRGAARPSSPSRSSGDRGGPGRSIQRGR